MLIQQFVGRRVVMDVGALESLIGHLVHATKVCPLDKGFLNSLFAVFVFHVAQPVQEAQC